MLSEALDFPTSGERGSAALLVGALALLLSFGFVVAGTVFAPLLLGVLLLQLVVRGYYVRVLRVTAVERSPVAPAFDDLTSLLRDGVGAIVVSVAYFLPALVLFSVAAGGNLASAVDNPLRLREPATIAAAETVGSLAALLGLFSVLGALYLVPGAVTLYAHENRLRSAFDLRRVVGGTLSEDYAVGWVITVVLQAFLLPIVLFLYSLLVGAFLHFFLAVAVRYIWGVSVGNALDIDPPTVDREGVTPDQGAPPKASGVPAGDRGARPTDSEAAPVDPPSGADEADETVTDARSAAATAAEPAIVPAEDGDGEPHPPSQKEREPVPLEPETPPESVEDEREGDGSSENRPRDPMEDESTR